MNVKERLKKVYEIEAHFIGNIGSEILSIIKNLEAYNEMFKYATKIDITKIDDITMLLFVLSENCGPVEKMLNYQSSELKVFNNASDEEKMYILNSKKESEEEYVSRVSMNISVCQQFLDMIDFLKQISKYQEKIENSGSNIKFLKNIEKVNKQMLDKMTQMNIGSQTLYDVAKRIIDYHFDEEFYKMASVDRLKDELAEKQSSVVKKEKPQEKPYKKANQNYEKINKELSILSEIDICGDETRKILDEKDEIEKTERLPFTATDVDRIVALTNGKFEKMIEKIASVKVKIANALEYVGNDIRDILRDSQPYIIRDYVAKLKTMSSKYDKLFSEYDKNDSASLLKLYKKANDLYAVIEEMRNNAYVVDIARFVK